MTPQKEFQPREEEWYKWGCGLHPHLYHFLLLERYYFNGVKNLGAWNAGD